MKTIKLICQTCKQLTDTQRLKVLRYAEEKKTLNDLKTKIEKLDAIRAKKEFAHSGGES